MEKENETTKAAERAVAAEAGIGQISPIAEEIGQISPTAEEGASLEERVERAVERCLAAREAPYIMAGGGSFAAAPPRRARTLEEAGRLAQELFRK